jgi:hypothetical protein
VVRLWASLLFIAFVDFVDFVDLVALNIICHYGLEKIYIKNSIFPLDALINRGVKSNAKQGFNVAISSALFKRKDIFHRIERGLYELKSNQKENLSIW